MWVIAMLAKSPNGSSFWGVWITRQKFSGKTGIPGITWVLRKYFFHRPTRNTPPKGLSILLNSELLIVPFHQRDLNFITELLNGVSQRSHYEMYKWWKEKYCRVRAHYKYMTRLSWISMERAFLRSVHRETPIGTKSVIHSISFTTRNRIERGFHS
jgi:hypothetical protein